MVTAVETFSLPIECCLLQPPLMLTLEFQQIETWVIDRYPAGQRIYRGRVCEYGSPRVAKFTSREKVPKMNECSGSALKNKNQ